MSEPFDVAIVGGGMVGASLAVALAPLGLRVALIEAQPFDAPTQPSFDERTTALSNGSRRILQTLDVWDRLEGAATPIARIHVSDQGRFGFARLDAREQGLPAMGYVVPNRALGKALWSRLQDCPRVRSFCPAQLLQIHPGAAGAALEIKSADGSVSGLEARLVVAADGVHSAVRQAYGIAAESREYGQTALIATVLPQRFHDHVAYERFTEMGPLALLPISDGRCTLVLTLASALAQDAMAWTDAEFLSEAQRRFGFRLGRFLKAGKRAAYPLSLTRSTQTSAPGCVIVGNAAQALHPVAGMGFNLGLRDAACLAELLEGIDCDDQGLREAYDAWRAGDRQALIAFTDGLVRVFASPLGAVRRLRNLALLTFDLLPPAKAALSSLSTGASARIPKLARGVALAMRS
jgi:2-octaprenyl-6-methoxyphenol hydroxylase